MARELSERQQKFLEVLFEEAGGDVVAAKKLAGYSETTRTSAIVKGLKEEILTGLVKTEKMQVEASGGVMLMPPKAVSEDD